MILKLPCKIRIGYIVDQAAILGRRIRFREGILKALNGFVLVLVAASAAMAGELYGTITDAGKPVPAGIKVEVVVAGKSYSAETDKFGTYHVFAAEKGKGALTAYYREQKPTADIFSYERATRYDWTVEMVEGKMTLKRK